MSRLKELLIKRKNLTANFLEEQEIINLSKNLSKEELSKIDPDLLTYSNDKRLAKLNDFLEKMINKIK